MNIEAIDIAKKMVVLAWKASHVVGMGAFQDKGPNLTDEQILAGAKIRTNNVYCDYVHGRMMKLWFNFNDKKEFTFRDDVPRADFQSWCGAYPTYEALYQAAVEALTKN
jgi:hypothetical protein